jgi:putative addiction module component (TIGR02574 family)
MTTQQLIRETASLPVEERIEVVDYILRTLNAPDSDIDKKWAEVAQKRLAELRSGKVKAIPAQEVFDKICR